MVPGQHDQNALFKEFYGSGSDQSLVNKKTPLASILMKNKKVDWVGDQFVQPVRFGSAVGLGYRSTSQNLPEPVAAPRGKAVFPAARTYGTAEFDREAIKASRNDKGAFAKVTVDEVNAVEEGFSLHMVERALFGDKSGKLAQVSALAAGSGTAASPWQLTGNTAPAAGIPVYKKRFFPRGAKLDLFTTGGVYQMTVQVVKATATDVYVILVQTGSQNTPQVNDLLYWEGNKGQECTGLALIAPASAGTLYGIDQSANPEFAGFYKDLSGATIAFDDVNNIISDLEDEIDSPNLAICGNKLKAAFKNQTEDQKRYPMSEIKSADGKIGFKGMQLVSEDGDFPLLSSQMCGDYDLWFVNTNYLQIDDARGLRLVR
jgi:hypothetical protein